MKVFADKHRTERAFKVGDVLLKLQPYCQSTARGAMPRKLSPRYFGPYTILERVGTVVYRLELLSSTKIHPVFHVSQLKKYKGQTVPIHSDPPSFWEMKPKESETIL